MRRVSPYTLHRLYPQTGFINTGHEVSSTCKIMDATRYVSAKQNLAFGSHWPWIQRDLLDFIGWSQGRHTQAQFTSRDLFFDGSSGCWGVDDP